MSYCAPFGPDLDALGIWWPRGDGAALRSTAERWSVMADYLDEMNAALDHAVSRSLDDYSGTAATC